MPSGPSDYLAAERNVPGMDPNGSRSHGLLGFVVARFGLFLRMLQGSPANPPAESFGFSFWAGTALITLGVIVNLLSPAKHHADLVRDLNAGGSGFNRPSSLGIVVAMILAVLGLAMAAYLISVRDPQQARPGVRSAESNDDKYRYGNSEHPK